MEQVRVRARVDYAGVGWRFAAVAVDTMVLFFLLVVIFVVLAAAGVLDLKNPAFSGGIDLRRTAPVWMYAVTYGLIFVYYTLLEALTAASVGKLVFRMRVTMDDGSKPSGAAIAVRNLIRLPEVLFWYIPAGISCVVNARHQRLGDLAAKTVVVRRTEAPATAATFTPAQTWPGSAPLPLAPPAGASGAPGGASAPPPQPDASDALAALKTAALAVRGAHLNYLRFSEVELARDAAAGSRGPGREPDDHAAVAPEPDYTPEYAAAWYTLADTVISMQKAHAAANAAATREGTTLPDLCADQPDLAYLFRELEPYFAASSDEEVHEAYMRVARGETTA